MAKLSLVQNQNFEFLIHLNEEKLKKKKKRNMTKIEWMFNIDRLGVQNSDFYPLHSLLYQKGISPEIGEDIR